MYSVAHPPDSPPDGKRARAASDLPTHSDQEVVVEMRRAHLVLELGWMSKVGYGEDRNRLGSAALWSGGRWPWLLRTFCVALF